MRPVHERVHERRHIAAEKDPAVDAPAVLQDQVLVVREPGQTGIFLRTNVEVARQRGRGARSERRQVETLRAGQADVGPRRAGERRQVNAPGNHRFPRLVGDKNPGEKLVGHRGPDDGAVLLHEGLRAGVLAEHAPDDAGAFQVAAIDELGVVTVVARDVQVLAVVGKADERRGAEAERGAGQRLCFGGEIAEGGFMPDNVGIAGGITRGAQDIAPGDFQGVLKHGAIHHFGWRGRDELVTRGAAETGNGIGGERQDRVGVLLIENVGRRTAQLGVILCEGHIADGSAEVGQAHLDEIVGKRGNRRLGAVLGDGCERGVRRHGRRRRGGGIRQRGRDISKIRRLPDTRRAWWRRREALPEVKAGERCEQQQGTNIGVLFVHLEVKVRVKVKVGAKVKVKGKGKGKGSEIISGYSSARDGPDQLPGRTASGSKPARAGQSADAGRETDRSRRGATGGT